jgi:trans-aconitate methyltransferase
MLPFSVNLSNDKPAVHHETYDPAYFRMIANVERRHFWFQARNAMIGDLVKQVVINMTPGYSLLEVGCGTGSLLEILERVCKDGTITGMDLYPEALKYARQRTSCRLELGDIRNAAFKNRFNLVCMCDVLEHLPDDEMALGRIHEIVLPGGVLMLTVPAFPSLWSYFDEVAHHHRRYTSCMLKRKLRDAGFATEYTSCFMSILLPVAYVARRLRGLRLRTADIMSKSNELVSNELKVNPVFNWLLGALLRWEGKLIRNRVTLRACKEIT